MRILPLESQEENKVYKQVDVRLSLYKCFANKRSNEECNGIIDCFYENKIEVLSSLFFPVDSLVHIDAVIPDFYNKRLLLAPLQGSRNRKSLHMYARVILQQEETIKDKLFYRYVLTTVIADEFDLQVFKNFIGEKK